MMRFKIISITFLFLLLISPIISLQAATVEYELTIEQKEVNFTGKPVQAMTINGAIPGPTLHFKDGDLARIKVHNKMDVESSIPRSQ